MKDNVYETRYFKGTYTNEITVTKKKGLSRTFCKHKWERVMKFNGIFLLSGESVGYVCPKCGKERNFRIVPLLF